jgi:putative sterol carrier protein
MNTHEPLETLVELLEKDEQNFNSILEKIIKAGVDTVNNAPELQEEISGYDDVYQTSILDVGYNYWLILKQGKLEYGKGIHPDATFTVSYTKNLIIKILKKEISGTDAFMKGKVRVDGDLSQGLHYIKIFRLFIQYLEKKTK